jgi:hypothetical protein
VEQRHGHQTIQGHAAAVYNRKRLDSKPLLQTGPCRDFDVGVVSSHYVHSAQMVTVFLFSTPALLSPKIVAATRKVNAD